MPILSKNKWSWVASRCKNCGTRSKEGRNKHKGNGLCFRCHDKERLKNPIRKENVKNAQKRFFDKNKNFEWFKKAHRETVKKYLDKNKDNPEFIENRRKLNNKRYHEILKKDYWYKKSCLVFQKKRREKKYFIEFIKKNPKYLKKYSDGIKYRCNGCNKDCLIASPIKPIELTNRMQKLERFRKLVIQECEESE